LSDKPNFELDSPKIVTDSEFGLLRGSFSPGTRVVFTNGCFDILHAGHVDLLTRAAKHGDILVLGLNSDTSVRSIKGSKRPVNSERHRAFVLAGLGVIDYVILFDEDTPYNLISSVRPDILIKGGDWSVDNIVGRDIVEGNGGKVLSLPLLPGYSTTDLLKRIHEEDIR
jgi:rfaE bifunctional protein nucleotidyltransferase chain/domain